MYYHIDNPTIRAHNKNRSVALFAGIALCIGLMIGALCTPLYFVKQSIDGREVKTNLGIYQSCSSGGAEQSCVDISTGIFACDDLVHQLRKIKDAYIASLFFFAVSAVTTGADFVGVMRNRLLHVIVLGIAVVCTGIGFLLVFLTYTGTFCGVQLSTAGDVSSPSASPFLCMVSGLCCLVCMVLAVVLKDRSEEKVAPLPAAVEIQEVTPQKQLQYTTAQDLPS